MSLIPRGWHEPAGLELRLSFPRWPFTLAKISVGVLLLVVLAGALVTVAWGPRTGGDSAVATRLPNVTRLPSNGTNDRFAIRYEVAAADHASDNEGWTVLYNDGSIVPARVVSGPPTFEPGTTSDVTLESGGGRPGSAPLRLRFDPHGKLGYSVPIPAAQR